MDKKPEEGRRRSTMDELVKNAIRFIGDRTQDGSTLSEFPDEEFHHAIGAADYKRGFRALKWLRDERQIMFDRQNNGGVPKSGGGILIRPTFRELELSPKGWKEYDRISVAKD